MDALLKFLNVFPNDPFQSLLSGLDLVGNWLGWLNWFIPVYQWVEVLPIWFTAYLTYWLISSYMTS